MASSWERLENINAREGIKTFLGFLRMDSLVSLENINAREGIKTEFRTNSSNVFILC